MRYLLKESFSLFYRTGIVSSIAKSDKIGKITHLAFSLEIMGADILEKLSLTAEKSLFPMRYFLKESFSLLYIAMLKGSFFKTGIISSVAKSDEIGKIAYLAFSLEIMGADILENLSLTVEKSLFALGTAWGTLFNECNEQFLTLFNKESLHQLSLITKSHSKIMWPLW